MAAITTATNSTIYEYSEVINLAKKDGSEINGSAGTDIEKDYSSDYAIFSWSLLIYVVAVWGSKEHALNSEFGEIVDLSKLR